MTDPVTLAIDPGGTGSLTLFRGLAILLSISFAHEKDWTTKVFWVCYTYRPDLCVFEDVHSMPGNGVASMFEFGYQTGLAMAPVTLCGVPVRKVTPQVWQRRLGLPHRREIIDKDKRRRQHRKDQQAFALAKFPHLQEWDKLVMRADGSKRERPDIWGSVCIGYAGVLDALGVPLGRLG